MGKFLFGKFKHLFTSVFGPNPGPKDFSVDEALNFGGTPGEQRHKRHAPTSKLFILLCT
jgi:hypothetical protein